MSDLKRIEDHLHQLIGLVGKIKETTDDTKKELAVVKQDVTAIRQDLSSLRQEFGSEKEWNRARSNEILKEVRNVSFEMEHLRNKTAKNESDLFVLKQSFSEFRS